MYKAIAGRFGPVIQFQVPVRQVPNHNCRFDTATGKAFNTPLTLRRFNRELARVRIQPPKRPGAFVRVLDN